MSTANASKDILHIGVYLRDGALICDATPNLHITNQIVYTWGADRTQTRQLAHAVPSESNRTYRLLSHFIVLQPEFKMD